tara:strand:+ start:113 stop:370 length:258 start_codon:yes stop_codon:yes gene_type:complete
MKTGTKILTYALATTIWLGGIYSLTPKRPEPRCSLSALRDMIIDFGETIAENPELFEQLIEKANSTTQPYVIPPEEIQPEYNQEN